jgi:hypothetical protein
LSEARISEPKHEISLSQARRMRYIRPMQELTRDHGAQPLDEMMTRWGLMNHDLVDASVEQLNHKQVQKARKGRQLTLHLMQKLTRALNDAVVSRLPKEERPNFTPYLHKHLFNYAKGYDAAWADPNEALLPK